MGLKDFRFYLSIFLRRLPHFLLFAVPLVALGMAVLFLLPNKYKASARILVEAPQISATLAPSTVPNDAAQQLVVYQQEIMVRDNLLSLAKRFGVFRANRFEMTDADIVEKMRARTSFELAANPAKDANDLVYNVSFEDDDPVVAANVVNELAAQILHRSSRARNVTASDTLHFFSREVTRLNDELKALDSRILVFKNEHRDSLPESLASRQAEQTTAQQRLQMLDWEEAGLRTRRESLIQMAQSSGGAGLTVALTPEQQTLQDLRRTLSDQLVLFAEDSPNIVALKGRIAALQASLRKSVGAKRQEKAVGKGGPTPLDMQLSDIDQRLEFIGKERQSLSKTLGALAKSIAATPATETALGGMQRNQKNVQSQYAAAVERYAAASTGKQIEANAKGERLSLVEPAVPLEHPTWPKRIRLGALVVLAGIAGGFGWIVLLELINAKVRRPADLVRDLNIRPIATIPSIAAKSSRFRPVYLIGLAALAGLSQFLWIRLAGTP